MTVFQPPRNLTLESTAWSLAINVTQTLTSPRNLTSPGAASWGSSKIAIMSNSTYGGLTLEFRWEYLAIPAGANALPILSPWSIPNASASAGYFPSIFYPAAFVGLASTSKSPATRRLRLRSQAHWGRGEHHLPHRR